MEFLFLIERVWPEILVFLVLLAILLFIAGETLYLRLKEIGGVFKRKPKITEVPQEKKSTPHVPTENIANDTVSDTNQIVSQESPAILSETPEEAPMPDNSHIEKLAALTSSARTLIARGMFVEARALIVEGLSLDKHHRELNLMLGQIYEQE